MNLLSAPLLAGLGMALTLLLSPTAHAQATTGSLAGWSVYGDAVSQGGAITVTTAYLDGDTSPTGDQAYNLSGASAVDVDTLVAAAGVGAYALDFSPSQYATEGSLVTQSFHALAGQTLSFDWSFTTHESGGYPLVEDRAFVVLNGQVYTLATFSQPGAALQRFSTTLGQTGAVSLALGVVDTVDDVNVSSLTVSNLRVASVSAVPEPTTTALMLAGLGLLAAATARRHRG